MTLPIVRYELDKTGKNYNNKVESEIHNLSDKNLRAVAPKHGAYFTESIKVYDDVTNSPLSKGIDYICTELCKEATLRYGKEICYVILITNKDVSSRVRISYQALGGAYSNIVDEMVLLYETAMQDNRKVDWANIVNKPYGFTPKLHSHLLKDVVGFEPLIDSIDRLGKSITLSNVPAFEYLIEYLNEQIDSFEDRLRAVVENEIQSTVQQTVVNMQQTINNINTFIERTDNPHNVTKEQIGLTNVQDLPLATDEEILAEDPVDKYITFRQLISYVKSSIEVAKLVCNVNYVLRDGVLNFVVNTTNIEDGRVIYWKLDNITTTNECFRDTEGTVVINNNTGSFNIVTTLEEIADGRFSVSIYKDQNHTKKYDSKLNLIYSIKVSDSTIDEVVNKELLVDSLTAESMFYSLAIDDYQDTLTVKGNPIKLISSIDTTRDINRAVSPAWLVEEVTAEDMYLDLVNGRFDN